MTQVARNITDVSNGFLRDKRYLLLDRDTKYSDAFRGILVREGIQVIRLPPRSPNLNAFAERFVRSIKSECLNRMIFFGQASLRHAIAQYLSHYHNERNHQGRGNQLLRPHAGMGLHQFVFPFGVCSREVLGVRQRVSFCPETESTQFRQLRGGNS